MEITFDPAKDAANIIKHGVSLALAVEFDWETANIRQDERHDYGEARMAGIGYIGLRLHYVAFVERDGGYRIISLRKANPRESMRYAQT